MEVPALEWLYAYSKQRAHGGTLEAWAEEYNNYRLRQQELLKERDLLKEDRPSRPYKTLTEAGLVNLTPTALRAALAYGFWHVPGLYHHLQLNLQSDQRRKAISIHLELNEQELAALEHRVKELLGREYLDISDELNKYLNTSSTNL